MVKPHSVSWFVSLKSCKIMERNSFTVLFFLQKAPLLKKGEISVCMRIAVNREFRAWNDIVMVNVDWDVRYPIYK